MEVLATVLIVSIAVVYINHAFSSSIKSTSLSNSYLDAVVVLENKTYDIELSAFFSGELDSTKTDTYNVLTTDIAKTLVMNSGDDKIFNLPSVGASNVRLFFTFIKIGVGKVTIQAADSDIIVDSGAGDTIYNDEATETYASITLQLISETHWVIVGASGTWVTTD